MIAHAQAAFSIEAAAAQGADRRVMNLGQDGRLVVQAVPPSASVLQVSAAKVAAPRAYPDLKVRADMTVSVPLVNAIYVQDTYGLSGAGVSICILDTGIDDSLSAFGGRIIDQACFCDDATPGDGVGCCPNGDETDTDAADDNLHGTAMAAIAASANGTYQGMAPGADIVAVKVLDAMGDGYLSDIYQGIAYCVDNADALGVKVISMSLGTDDLFPTICDDENVILTDKVDEGYNHGISFYSSTGNEASNTSIRLPGCLSSVMAVGASTKLDAMAPFTNHGLMLDILAPGSSVSSLIPGNGVATLSGTSMAVPHVAGAAALLLEEDPTLTPEELHEALVDSDVQIEGYPRLNLKTAYDHVVESGGGPVVVPVPEYSNSLIAILATAGALAGVFLVRRR